MLSNGFARPLHLKRSTSRLLAMYLVGVYTLALLALLLPLAIPSDVHVLLFVFWGCSAVYHGIYFYRQRDEADRYWVWQAGGGWLYADEERVYSQVSQQSLQTPWFVILSLVSPGLRRERLLIIRDQVDADTYRRLRVRLKLHHDEAATSGEEAV